MERGEAVGITGLSGKEEGAFVQKTKQGGRATISKPRKNKNLEEKTYLWCTTRFYREPYLYSSLIQ